MVELILSTVVWIMCMELGKLYVFSINNNLLTCTVCWFFEFSTNFIVANSSVHVPSNLSHQQQFKWLPGRELCITVWTCKTNLPVNTNFCFNFNAFSRCILIKETNELRHKKNLQRAICEIQATDLSSKHETTSSTKAYQTIKCKLPTFFLFN